MLYLSVQYVNNLYHFRVCNYNLPLQVEFEFYNLNHRKFYNYNLHSFDNIHLNMGVFKIYTGKTTMMKFWKDFANVIFEWPLLDLLDS